MSCIKMWQRALACCLAALVLFSSGCHSPEQQLLTIADARSAPAVVVDIGPEGDSVGDMVIFDQPLLDAAGDAIGTNSGFCVRTDPGRNYQCQWTLSMAEGAIQVAGREFDQGESRISIVGGSGAFRSIAGHMTSVKNEHGNFVQTLNYRL